MKKYIVKYKGVYLMSKKNGVICYTNSIFLAQKFTREEAYIFGDGFEKVMV